MMLTFTYRAMEPKDLKMEYKNQDKEKNIQFLYKNLSKLKFLQEREIKLQNKKSDHGYEILSMQKSFLQNNSLPILTNEKTQQTNIAAKIFTTKTNLIKTELYMSEKDITDIIENKCTQFTFRRTPAVYDHYYKEYKYFPGEKPIQMIAPMLKKDMQVWATVINAYTMTLKINDILVTIKDILIIKNNSVSFEVERHYKNGIQKEIMSCEFYNKKYEIFFSGMNGLFDDVIVISDDARKFFNNLRNDIDIIRKDVQNYTNEKINKEIYV